MAEGLPSVEAAGDKTRRPQAGGVGAVVRAVVRFLDSNRGITALLAVLVVGALFTPQPGMNGPFVVNLLLRNAERVERAQGPPQFLSGKLHSDVLFEYSEYGLLAAGMTLVILTGGIDLSVGSVLGISAVVFSVLHIAYGVPLIWSILGAVLIGSACGLINGLLVARVGLQPFVATLAMMVAARGGAKVISGGIKVAPGAQDWYYVHRTPAFMEWMTSPMLGGFLRPVTVLFVVVIIVMALVVRYTRFGRHLYAMGGNEEAARLSGVPVRLSKATAYVACGTLAGLAGICNASSLRLGNPEAGFTFELDAIAAVVIGGTSLQGGRGSMVFTLIGTLIIGYINKILSVNAVPEAYRLLAKGLIIVAAVVVQSRRKSR